MMIYLRHIRVMNINSFRLSSAWLFFSPFLEFFSPEIKRRYVKLFRRQAPLGGSLSSSFNLAAGKEGSAG